MIRTLVKLEDILEVNPSSWSKKEGWTYLRYLDTANITNGRINEIVTFDTKTDKIPSRARRIVQNGDFVYSTVRPNQKHFGLLKNIEDNLVVSTGFAVLRSKYPEDFDTRFIYLLVTQDFITNYLHGIAENNTSAYPALRPQDITDLEFEIPPISDQKLIADFIENLDDKIELNQKMNHTLEEIAKAIFKSWFVDFDPVRAKAEGRPTGLPPEISDLFPDELVDSEIGEIPKGWGVVNLKAISTNRSKSVKPDQMSDFPSYVGLEHVPRGHIFLSSWGNPVDVESNKTAFEQGDILFGKLRPYFEKCVIAPQSGVCSTDIVAIEPNADAQIFVACFISQKRFFEFTSQGSTGTRMPRTSWKHMCEYDFALPCSELLETFQSFVAPMIQKGMVSICENDSLAELRDTLLPKLISGELRIPDAEKFLEEAGI